MYFWCNEVVYNAISNRAFGSKLFCFGGYVKVSRNVIRVRKCKAKNEILNLRIQGKEETMKCRIEIILIAC